MPVVYMISPSSSPLFPDQIEVVVLGPEGEDLSVLWRQFRRDKELGLSSAEVYESTASEPAKRILIEAQESRRLADTWSKLYDGGFVNRPRPNSKELVKLFVDWLVSTREGFSLPDGSVFVSLDV